MPYGSKDKPKTKRPPKPASQNPCPVVNCGNCSEKIELKKHINRCVCGAVTKTLE